MNLTTLGIDLAKTSFSLVGMNERGKVIFRKTLKRDALMAFIAQCPQCLIGMEPVVVRIIGPENFEN